MIPTAFADTEREFWPVTLAQETTLLTEELAAKGGRPTPIRQFPLAFVVNRAVDVSAIQGILADVCRRHPSLQATYSPPDSIPERTRNQMVALFSQSGRFHPGLYRQGLSPHPVEITFSAGGETATDAAVVGAIRHEAATPLPTDAPRFRAHVRSLADGNRLLTVTVSNLILDGWSAGLLREEVLAGVGVRRLGAQREAAPSGALHAGQFAAWEHQRLAAGEFSEAFAYWINQRRRALPAVIRHEELPFGATSSSPPHPSRRIGTATRQLSVSDSNAVRRAAAKLDIAPHTLMRTAFTALPAAYVKRDEISFWANFSNRSGRTARMMAACAHAHLVYVSVPPTFRPSELCRHVGAALTEAQRHQAVSEAALVLLGAPRIIADTRITFDAWPPLRCRATDDVIRPLLATGCRQSVDLDVRYRDEGNTFAVYGEYNADRYDSCGVERVLEQFVRATSLVAADSVIERQQLCS